MEYKLTTDRLQFYKTDSSAVYVFKTYFKAPT